MPAVNCIGNIIAAVSYAVMLTIWASICLAHSSDQKTQLYRLLVWSLPPFNRVEGQHDGDTFQVQGVVVLCCVWSRHLTRGVKPGADLELWRVAIDDELAGQQCILCQHWLEMQLRSRLVQAALLDM